MIGEIDPRLHIKRQLFEAGAAVAVMDFESETGLTVIRIDISRNDDGKVTGVIVTTESKACS